MRKRKEVLIDINTSAADHQIKPIPRISVIIPTYNRGEFVVKAIDSVLNQTFEDYEIIVIDDGSTDDTCKILEVYGSKIKYFFQENTGVSSARNTGIKEAKGEWISFLDSDDEWEVDYLSTQMTQAKEFPHALAHMTNAVSVSSNGKKRNYFSEISLLNKFGNKQCLVFEKPLRPVVKHSVSLLQSLIIRKDIILDAGLFDTTLSIAEDQYLIARIAMRGAFTFHRRELVKVIRREEGIENLMAQSFRRSIYRYESFAKVYSDLLKNDSLSWLEKGTLSFALSHSWRALGNALIFEGKRPEARRYYKKSFIRYPSIRSGIKYVATFFPATISYALVRKSRNIQSKEDLA